MSGPRYSHRLDWSLPPNRISRILAEKRATGAPILDLTESNPTNASIDYPEGLAALLVDPRAARYQPDPLGLRPAREAIAAYTGGDPERLVLTASTSEAYSWLFKLLCDPGDRILTPRPSYPLFEFLARLESVEVDSYQLYYQSGWHMDVDSIQDAITERTRAIVLVNPNNPTGSFLKRAELDILIAVAVDRNIPLISDEVFAKYAFEQDPDRVTTVANIEGAHVFALSGLSKLAGLPQMKLGWIALNGPRWREVRDRLELIADTYLSVGAPVQYAAERLLESAAHLRAQILARTQRNLKYLKQRVVGSHCDLLQVEGGWYATLQAPRTRPEENWIEGLLLDCDVLVQPGFFYDFPHEAFLVVSLLTPEPVFQRGVDRIVDFTASAGC